MRHMFALQQALYKKPSTCSVTSAAVELCKSAEKAIISVVQDSKPMLKTTGTQQNQNPAPLSVLSALERAHELLHRGLDKLIGSADAMKAVGILKYHLVCLFETAMCALQQRCRVGVEEMATRSKPTKKQKRVLILKLSKAVNLTGHSPHVNSNDDIAARIANVLMTMILKANNSTSKRETLLDGYLFVLLNRVGKVLCQFVFQDLELRPDLRIDSTKLPCPDGLIEASLDDVSLQGMEAESKHLIWLVERAIALTGTSSILSMPESVTETNIPPSGSISVSLQSIARKRLQNTVLQAVFGEDDPLFSDALKPLERPADLHFLSQPPKQATREWFTKEVWRLLGWDVLTRESRL
jgi:hypothetical protein